MDPLYLGLGLCVVAGLADLAGGSVVFARTLSSKQLASLVALSAGFILAVTLLERLPSAAEALPRTGLLFVLAGYVTLFVAENLFARTAHEAGDHHHHHHHVDFGSDSEHVHATDALVGGIHPPRPLITPTAGLAAYVGLGIHAFFDGAAIVAGFLVDVRVGVLLFIAVIMHKGPEGLSMASITLASGRDRGSALLRAGMLGAATIAGGIAAAALGSIEAGAVEVFLALATGSFLYVAATDLVPAANEGRTRLAILWVIAGIALFLASEQLLGLAGLEA